MTKKEYKFNPQTFAYEVVAAPSRLRLYRLLRKVLIGFILASLVNFLFSYFFYTPKMHYIEKENRQLLMEYDLLQGKISAATAKVDAIRHRDQNVYRPLFGVDSVSMPSVYREYPDSKYAAINDDMYGGLMVGAWKSLDAMARRLYMESVSLDQLEGLSADKEDMALAVPATWPIDPRTMTGRIGLFGMRTHPTLHVYKPHTGIDLPANTGTPVYATGNGIIEEANYNNGGYGRQVLVNHKYGYKTRYAHLSKILVVPGQEVKRGEIIGEVGNTGRSVGPHLHYEVILLGNHVDPINYFRMDMSEEDFEKIIQSAGETIYETD